VRFSSDLTDFMVSSLGSGRLALLFLFGFLAVFLLKILAVSS